jgi:fructose-1,6-bisphosphatase/inositol monophosphatase family enzyme
MITRQQEAALLAITETVADEEILPRFRALDPAEITTKTHGDDLVTIADKRSELRLTQAIRDILPGAEVIGEEAISDDPSLRDRIDTAATCAIIDPVDGTWNFANGLGLFGVILAVSAHGQTVWGGIYDPMARDWMVASKGGGAWYQAPDGRRTRLDISNGPDTVGACRGNLPVYLFDRPVQHRLAAMIPDFQRSSCLRCSAHDYRMLARGSFDFSICPILNPWDHAAGCLIVQEAGGVARLLDGRDYAPTQRIGCLLTARSETLWQALADKFTPAL